MRRAGIGMVVLAAGVAGCSRPADAPTTSGTVAHPPELHVFAPGTVSQPGASRAYAALAPDGRTLYVARYAEFGGDGLTSIEVSRRADGAWTAPETASFSGTWHDHQPSVSPDGRYLYFVSRRPVDGAPREDYELWRIEIRPDGFGEPEHLSALGSPEGEYAPFVARSGRIYFSSTREGGLGSGDLYVAEPEGDGFSAPRSLGAPVNGEGGEWGAALDADERLLVYERSGREENLSASGDLWVSRREGDGWSPPRHLGAPIASTASDLAPRLSADGRRLVFSSNRSDDVLTYEIDLAAALATAEPATGGHRP